MRRIFVLSVVVAVMLSVAAPGYCQGAPGIDASFGIGVLNGPALEVKGSQWMIQGAWLMWVFSSGDFTNDFDEGYVLRADYIYPLGAAGVSGGEVGIGYTYAHFQDDGGAAATSNDFNENGINLQYMYSFQPNISFRAGYDYFFDPDPGSIDGMWTFGLMYHF